MKTCSNNVKTGIPASRPGSSLFARGLPQLTSRRGDRGFTLEEVVVSMAIAAIVIGVVTTGYVTMAKRAEWSAYSAAAQSAALQQVEQIRTAKWDPLALPAIDELVGANFPLTTSKLDISASSGAVGYVTNRTTITPLSVNPPLKLIRVESAWSLNSRAAFTNTVTTYRSP